jgi:hypothetical protein
MKKLGGTCSILDGIVFAISGFAFFLSQVGRFDWNSISSISDYLVSRPTSLALWKIVNGGAALAAFTAIAGVLALSDVIKPAHEGYVRWTSTLAIIGYSIIAVTNIADLYQIKRMALGYVIADESAKSALEIIGIGTLDPTLSLRFITIGSWLLTAGWFSASNNLLPKTLAYFGVIAGITSLGFALASFFELQTFTLLAGSVAVIFHPVWLIWTGIILRQNKAIVHL